MNERFYPPGRSRLARRVVGWLMPWLRRYWSRVDRVVLAPDDARRLRETCAAGPALLCPNHPSLHEAVILYETLTRLGLHASFMADLGALRASGVWRSLLQGAGAYSIRRGTADRDAFAATRQLLVEGKQIVIFPEGETYGLNDTLLEFHEGVAQMAFWGQADRVKAGLDNRLRLLPIAVKYVYHGDCTAHIDAALGRLEERFGLSQPCAGTRYERLRLVGFAYAAAQERAAGVSLPESATLDEHIAAIFERLLVRVSASLGVEHPPGATLQDRLRRLYHLLEEQQDQSPGEIAAWRAFEHDLRVVQCFQAVRDGYVAAHPTAERYLDVLGRLERALTGRVRYPALRQVIVKVGEPLELAEWQALYKDQRRTALSEVTAELRRRVAALLDSLHDASAPIEPAT